MEGKHTETSSMYTITNITTRSWTDAMRQFGCECQHGVLGRLWHPLMCPLYAQRSSRSTWVCILGSQSLHRRSQNASLCLSRSSPTLLLLYYTLAAGGCDWGCDHHQRPKYLHGGKSAVIAQPSSWGVHCNRRGRQWGILKGQARGCLQRNAVDTFRI